MPWTDPDMMLLTFALFPHGSSSSLIASQEDHLRRHLFSQGFGGSDAQIFCHADYRCCLLVEAPAAVAGFHDELARPAWSVASVYGIDELAGRALAEQSDRQIGVVGAALNESCGGKSV